MTKTKTMTVRVLVLALLAQSGTAFAQDAPKVERKFYNQTLGLVGLASMLTGVALMVPMQDPNATTVALPRDSYCVTTNTTRQRVDVTDGGCGEMKPMRTAGLITMGAGAVMALVGFHRVTVSPQVSPKSVSATMSVTW